LVAVTATAGGLYQSPIEALKAVREDYHYWTGKLTETSVQLSYALIAANWAVFGSVDKILASFWSKLSITLVVVGLGFTVAAAKGMGEILRNRIEYAEADTARWQNEFTETSGKRVAWPFTDRADSLGRWMREAKTWIPLAAGVSFLVALFSR
jgi:hypothetical protein